MIPSPLRRATMRANRALGALLAAMVVLGASPSAPAQAVAPTRALPQLTREAAAAPERTFRVLIGRAGRGRAVDAYVTGRGQRKLKDVGSHTFVAELKGREIAALSRHPGVRWVTIDAPVAPTSTTIDSTKLVTIYNQTLNTTGLWNAGLNGKGVAIAVIDTGIDESSGDFRDPATGVSRVVARVNTTASPAAFADGFGHGTHVAGIAAGNSWSQASGQNRGKYVGVAPGANLISVRVGDDLGRTYLSDVMEGIDWVIANRQTYNIRVLNLSMQSTVAESAGTSYLAAAVERAWLNGILVVVAAGNIGPNAEQYPPANDPFVIAVGASDPLSTAGRSDDGMAPWSSYGTTQEGFAKPDVVAPGRYIASNLVPGSVLGGQFPTRIVDGSYIWLSGTSMAAPQVAGVAALAFQRNPGLTNDAVKWLLMQTATPLSSGSVALSGQGAGLVDAQAAVMYSGTPGVANSGLRINPHLTGPNGATTYTTAGTTTPSWAEGGWDTTSWTEGGWDTSSWSEGGWDNAPQSAPWAQAAVQ
jgi:serine protease AprX